MSGLSLLASYGDDDDADPVDQDADKQEAKTVLNLVDYGEEGEDASNSDLSEKSPTEEESLCESDESNAPINESVVAAEELIPKYNDVIESGNMLRLPDGTEVPLRLPNPPPTSPSPKLQEKVERFTKIMEEKQTHVNATLRKSKAFRNPSILEKYRSCSLL